VPPRFHARDLDPETGHATLTNEEAGHLTRVLRLGPGADVDVFDGHGRMFHAVVTSARPGRVELRVLAPAPAASEPAVRVTLVMSALKADKMDAVIRDATMMGAQAIQPVVSTRSEVSLLAIAKGRRVDRWTRVAVASAKQSGRAIVPSIEPPLPLDEWLSVSIGGTRVALVEPTAGTGVSFSSVPRAPAVSLIVGPEGGWTPDEMRAFDTEGVTGVSLGPRTLRAEAAPLVAMAALFEAWSAWAWGEVRSER
jgi:16S rRNA (uracil1498-N3)-methyltransferase